MATALLKFGGDVVAEPGALSAVLADVARLHGAGWRFVLCHGGGPQANALQERLGLTPRKVGGRRVTDAATLQVVKCVLAGEVSVDVVAAVQAAGLRGVGLTAHSGGVVQARRWPPQDVAGEPEPVDYGFVGQVERVDPTLLQHLWSGGFVPVLNPIGGEPGGQGPPCEVFNINADTIAVEVAAALAVDHLFLMTGVPGVLRDRHDPDSRIPRLDVSGARRAIAEGVIAGGMIPKVQDVLPHLERSDSGIGAVHILGAGAGVLEAEARGPGSRGTVLVPDAAS